MTQARTLFLLACAALPNFAFAQVCETNTYDLPLPGATQVEWRFADVPSARSPNEWQEGLFKGYPYRIFPDGQAMVASHLKRPAWRVEVDCDLNAGSCSYQADEVAPLQATSVAQEIGQCLLGGTTEPEPVIVEDTSPEPEVANTGECDAVSIPEGNTVISLQRLLVIAGADPGPVDGFIGPTTLNALGSVLGGAIAESDLEQALTDLKIFICAQS